MEWLLPEEWDDFAGKFLGLSETLREQHNLGDELPVGSGHSQGSEEFLQIVREIGSSGITGIHGDENGHIGRDLHLFAHKLNTYT